MAYTPIGTHTGTTEAVFVFHDVSQEQTFMRELAWQATHDQLTGLVNRYEFERRLSRGETAKMRQLLGITRDEDLLAVLAGRFTSTELLEAFIHGHGISGRFWSRLGD